LVKYLFVRRRELQQAAIQKILVVEVNRLGDVISALPALKALRVHFPHAEISFLARRSFVPLFEQAGFVDKVIGLSESPRIRSLLAMVVRLRKERFDLSCSLSPIRRNAFLTLLGGSRYAVGYLKFGRRVPNFLKESSVSSIGLKLVSEEHYAQENIVETSLKVCRALGISCPETRPRLDLPEGVIRGAEQQLSSEGKMPSVPFVVVHPFAGWRFREWPYGNTIELVKRILSDPDIHVVLIGSPEDEEKLRWMRKQTGKSKGITIAAGEDLATLAVLLGKSLLFVGNDSGPIHLASALGIRCIGLFGPAPPHITGPAGTNTRFLYRRLECSPCKQKKCIRPQDPCLSLISVDEVYAEVKEVLSEAIPSRVG
jgi:ADP-heptose:LPS heptosyltransferase